MSVGHSGVRAHVAGSILSNDELFPQMIPLAPILLASESIWCSNSMRLSSAEAMAREVFGKDGKD